MHPDGNVGSPDQQVIEAEGLRHPVEIIIDDAGMAHIRAADQHDLFFAQGYNVARDRLWQIDLWRKRGLGLLAADFGPGYLAQDQASRLFLYRGDMEAEWAAYAPDAKDICEAFVEGINAYVAHTEAGKAELPQEFGLLGTKPSRWSAEDVVRIRSHCLTRNAISEVVRANVLALAGGKADAMRKQLEPVVSPFVDPDLGDVPLAVIDIFKLATASVSFSKERLSARPEDAARWSRLNTLGEVIQQSESQGSNNWAISAARTATGRPIIAMDPHRTHAVPSVRYMVHLSMPGFDAIGAGEPSAPGISMGHNGHSSFAITIFGADQEDTYVYETRPGNSNAYRYGEGWEEIETVVEEFAVKGYPSQRLPLRFTRHGPVVYEQPEKQRAYAIRTVWSEPGAAPYMASLSVMRARSFDEYRAALRNWGTPSINHVYADKTGAIGWQTVGKTPIRPNWDGLVPIPGDGRYEWAGFIAPEDMPSSLNPDKGFVATANEMNIPKEWSAATDAVIGYEWIDRSRSERIHEVLRGQPSHTLKDSCALQNDIHSIAADRMMAAIEGLDVSDEAAGKALSHLRGWNRSMDASSSPAALFEIWVTSHLKPALYEACGAGNEVLPLMQPGDIQSVLDLMERPETWLGSEARKSRDRIAERTLAAAWKDCGHRLGGDADAWEWGKVHLLSLTHAVSGAFPETAASFDIQPIELGGSGSTPAYAVYRPDDFQTITGPSVRMVIDVGAWDNSLFINLPGQSGRPASPHYRDLKDAWRNGEYRQLAYSQEAVERAATSRLELRPPRG